MKNLKSKFQRVLFSGIILCAMGLVISPFGLFPTREATAAEIVQELTFAWKANTEKDLAGYRLYRSDKSGKYVYGKKKAIATMPVGTETVKLKGIKPGWFVLTAYDKHGNESGPSKELESIAPLNPDNVTVTIVVKIVQGGN